MKLRIESDGTPHGTRLLTEDGETIEGVTYIHWSVDAKEPRSTAVIMFNFIAASIRGVSEIEPLLQNLSTPCVECGGPVGLGEGWRLVGGGVVHDDCGRYSEPTT